MQIPQKLILLLAIAVLAAGCAVKTAPVTQQDLVTRIKEDGINMYKDQEPLAAALSLEEAMARGLKYNLDHRVKLLEDALSLRQVEVMTFDMLPRVVAAAGYSERDSYNASSSTNVYTWMESLAPSTSQDKGHYTADLTMTWNILDFGISYFQAKQQAERSHIMAERRRKVVHTIFQQIRQGYWQALGAQQLESKFTPLLKEVNDALQDINRIEQEMLRPPLETLNYKKTLLEIMKNLEGFRDELAQAKPRLASLINLPSGQAFTLVNQENLTLPEIKESLEVMEMRALLMRPELRETDYNERVSAHEVKKTILRMLPGFEMTVGGHYDSNTFLLNQRWIEGSARLTWNLLNLLSGPTQYIIASNQTELVKTQRMALSIAVITQVHVAYQDFISRKRQYELSDQLLTIDYKIHEQTSKQTRSGAENRLNEIKTATSLLMADYRRYQNYAALQNAYGQMTTTLGHDPLPDTVTGHDLKTLTREIKKLIDPTPVSPKADVILAPVPAPAAAAPDQKPAVDAPKAEPAAKPVTRAEEPVSKLSPPLADDKRAVKYDVATEPQREPKSAGIPKIDSMKAK
ncbi:MAG: TolC family protein [Deltaproteobacteria bacterium]